MSRLSKFLLLFTLLVFILACNTVTKPITDVQNVAGTAQSYASAMPNLASTVEAVATNMPMQTLEAVASQMPDITNMFDPKGEPVKEWKGVPVMTQATAGQEFPDTKSYSFKATATVKDATDFYNDAMVKAGWSTMFSMPGDANGAILAFQKESNIVTITITTQGDSIVVLLTFA